MVNDNIGGERVGRDRSVISCGGGVISCGGGEEEKVSWWWNYKQERGGRESLEVEGEERRSMVALVLEVIGGGVACVGHV